MYARLFLCKSQTLSSPLCVGGGGGGGQQGGGGGGGEQGGGGGGGGGTANGNVSCHHRKSCGKCVFENLWDYENICLKNEECTRKELDCIKKKCKKIIQKNGECGTCKLLLLSLRSSGGVHLICLGKSLD